MNIKDHFTDEKIFTLSNLLSIIRIPLGIILYILIINYNTLGAIAIALLGILSDYADGYFARRRNEVTELGKILDPIGDKVIVALGSIALYKTYGLPAWIVFLILGRDLLIIFGSLILSTRIKKIVASELPGKIAVFVISLLLLSYLFKFDIVKNPLLFITAVLIVFSFIFYLKKFVVSIKYKSSENKNNVTKIS